ncbi:helix-turn-helix domain-containing protein [Oscillochloris sp. ZM17-4]|nr:helix-turn-helix domain-containing protein [Oscillochloris sp. ZM17-4]
MNSDRRSFDRELGTRLREARLTLGATQGELAQALGVSSVTVARYELGERSLPIAQLPRISRLLRCPITSLLPGGGDVPVALPSAPTTEPMPAPVTTIARLLVEHPEIVPQLLDMLEQLLERQSTDNPRLAS